MNSALNNFEKMLASGQDSALLRYSLGNAYIDAEPEKAVLHLEQAVSMDANYSAAWKVLGKARTALGDTTGAIDAFETGIKVAETNGDVQAKKEMRVFLRRLEKRSNSVLPTGVRSTDSIPNSSASYRLNRQP